jgi:RNA polymerase sigma-70 factor (ECF subfamily)
MDGARADTADCPSERVAQGQAERDRRQLDRALQHCLDDLPPDFRTIVILVDIQGMDYVEAAASTSKPLGTVKSRLARARMRMRDCLQGFWELLPLSYRLEDESEA